MTLVNEKKALLRKKQRPNEAKRLGKNNFAAQYIVGNNMQYGRNREEVEQHYFFMFIINFHYNFINQVQRFVVHLS